MTDDSIATPADTPETLPTEPGWYLDRDGDVWRIDGNRRTAIASGYEHLTAEKNVPFTRLYPLSQLEAEFVAMVLMNWGADRETCINVARRLGADA